MIILNRKTNTHEVFRGHVISLMHPLVSCCFYNIKSKSGRGQIIERENGGMIERKNRLDYNFGLSVITVV